MPTINVTSSIEAYRSDKTGFSFFFSLKTGKMAALKYEMTLNYRGKLQEPTWIGGENTHCPTGAN